MRTNGSVTSENAYRGLRQSGQEYIGIKGCKRNARKVAISCGISYRFKCKIKIPIEARTKIFHDFWKLCDNEKNNFYARTTERHVKNAFSARVKTKV